MIRIVRPAAQSGHLSTFLPFFLAYPRSLCMLFAASYHYVYVVSKVEGVQMAQRATAEERKARRHTRQLPPLA